MDTGPDAIEAGPGDSACCAVPLTASLHFVVHKDASTDAKVTMIASLLAAPPPRRVPPGIRRLALRSRGSGCLVLFGLVFGLFGSVFVAAFFPWQIVRELRLKSPNAVTTPGTIISAESTSFSINETKVMRYDFEFRVERSGDGIRGTCHTTGARWPAGTVVDVRYLPDDPSIACPVGARLSEGSLSIGLMVLIFPAIGFGIVYGVRQHRRTILNTLHRGVALEARVSALERTGTQINDESVFRISLVRTDRPSDPPMTVKRHDPAVVNRARQYYETKQPMYILVDPQRPKRALLPETW